MVEGFVGKGASCSSSASSGSATSSSSDVRRRENEPVEQLARAIGLRRRWGVIVDDRDRPVRWVRDHTTCARRTCATWASPPTSCRCPRRCSRRSRPVLSFGCVSAIVTGRNGRYEGVVVIETLMSAIRDLRGSTAGDLA